MEIGVGFVNGGALFRAHGKRLVVRPVEGGKVVGWAQHYTDQVVLAADLGLLVQDLV